MLKTMIKKVPGAKEFAHALSLTLKRMDDRRFLLEMLPKNSVGVEIGVHKGDFAQEILEAISPKELHLIDPWKHEVSPTYKDSLYGGLGKNGQKKMDKRYSKVCARFDQEIRRGLVKIHRGYSADILNQFPDEYFDWVYIDGNHLYEYVKKDIMLSFRKTKVEGYIAGDDYLEGGWWQGGIKKAVDEFARTKPGQLIEIHNDQFIFRKKS